MKKIIIQYFYILLIISLLFVSGFLTGCTSKNASSTPGTKGYMNNVVEGLKKLGGSGTVPK